MKTKPQKTTSGRVVGKRLPVVDSEDHQSHPVTVEATDLNSLERQSTSREKYINQIKRYLTSDSTPIKAPKRLETNIA